MCDVMCLLTESIIELSSPPKTPGQETLEWFGQRLDHHVDLHYLRLECAAEKAGPKGC